MRRPARWAVAAAVLAVMVFVITVAMNYLGGPRAGQAKKSGEADLDRSLNFVLGTEIPTKGDFPVEAETGRTHQQDYWFVNENDKEVVIGLKRKACRCTAVEVYVLPESRAASPTAAALLAGSGGPLHAVCSVAAFLPAFGPHPDLRPDELMQQRDSVGIPARATGWLRLRWTADRAGPQSLGAVVWMNDKDRGPEANLELRAVHHDAMRVRSALPVGVVTDDELARGVTKYIYVWSSTRESFAAKAESAWVRAGGKDSDPFEVGVPVPLNAAERAELEQLNASEPGFPGPPIQGRVLSGYKVPVTLRALSKDGKVPFDVGQFRRGVRLSCPEAGGEEKVVTVSGRVSGVVELGEKEDWFIDFRTFRRVDGTKDKMEVTSSVPGLKLTFDRSRTPAWLDATLKGPVAIGETRQGWTVAATVRRGQVSGSFPRAEDPLYEDSAVYLRAEVPGRPPRPIRIAVRGTANES